MRYIVVILIAGLQMVTLFKLSGQGASEVLTTTPLASSIAIPVSMPYTSIEKMLNNNFKGLLYEDNSYTDNNNDQFKIKVWKKDNIKLSTLTSNQIRIAVPLKIWAEKGVGALGYVSYQSTEFAVTLRFKTSYAIRPDWTIKTVTEPDGYEWHTKPVLKYTYVDIPITPLVASALEDEQARFCKIIDEQVGKSLDLKPYAIQTWNALTPPMLVSEEYHTWLKLTPKAIKCMPLKSEVNRITGTIGIDLLSETFVGCKPDEVRPVATVPALVLTKELKNDFHIETAVSVLYPHATEIANKQFKGQVMEFLNGKKVITIESINVLNEKTNILLEATISGSLNGVIVIKGLPYVDEINQRIALKDVDFHLKTKNLFHKSASWLFGGSFEKMIEKDYGIPLGDIKLMARNGLKESINRELYPGIKMSGDVNKLDPTQVILNDEGLLIYVHTDGTMKIDIDELTF